MLVREVPRDETGKCTCHERIVIDVGKQIGSVKDRT